MLVPVQHNMDTIHRLEKMIRDELGLISLGAGGEKRIRSECVVYSFLYISKYLHIELTFDGVNNGLFL